MGLRTLCITLLFALGSQLLQAQHDKWYLSTSGELIFSSAEVDFFGNEDRSTVRLSAFFNSQSHINRDLHKSFGIFTGMNIRNIGFIWKEPNTTHKTKYRTYNLGIPAGIKIGDLEKRFVYAGYEIEFPFHYKEKFFSDGTKKSKQSKWFSKKVPAAYHTVMLGTELKNGLNVKVKYYLNGFFNQNYTETVAGQTIKPFDGFDANVFYISVSSGMLKKTKNPAIPLGTPTTLNL